MRPKLVASLERELLAPGVPIGRRSIKRFLLRQGLPVHLLQSAKEVV
jgi:hypothetical protein